ncbi:MULTISPECIES: MarR family winged helix-turn-helix transcriptional regulator [Hymenobacter]|uniref:MarR family transcriptional regulator n=1 Tax=Hymenobacter profundi TaxID=1982110 RepID=A0ABS6X0A5_9BACT|nr:MULTISPECIES: MarR family transcriptional regulator [Hymenobacter]MBW3129264.1 MarR family transcriptional regulator [Hymenobacter profundi]QNE38618.1 MarR family transcriptional regulator [Hymenobacter sp. NBH84]
MAQAPEPTTSEEDFSLLKLENQLCFPLYAASRQLTKAYQPYLRELDPDLTYPQYLVLLLLWEHQEMTVKELGENLLLDSGTLTPLLKRMEQKQWVSRRRDPRDERSVIIGLLPAGEVLQKPACSIPKGLLAHLEISTKELATLRRLLDHVIKKLT